MKYATLISVIALVVLVACSTGDEPNGSDTFTDAIVFGCGTQETEKVSTRAATPQNDVGIGSFRVWAYKNDGVGTTEDNFTSYQTVINGYRVWWETALSTSNKKYWEYVDGTSQTIKFWDPSAHAYRFMAIAPSTAVYAASISGDTDQSLNIRMPIDATNEADVPYYSKLWFSTGNIVDFPDKPFNSVVLMKFLKPIAYVRFMFTYDIHEDEEPPILSNKSFKPTDGGLIEQKGDVTISYPLTGTGNSETLSVATTGLDGVTAFTQDYYVTPADAHACTYYTVLPAINQGSYTLKVSVNGEPKSLVVPEQYMDWLPGYEYTYVFEVRLDGSVAIDNVQSAFTGWVIHEGNRTVYNW